MIQGENFRPNGIEQLIDELLEQFIKDLESIDDADFAKAKQAIVEDLTDFTTNLDDVSNKYYLSVEESAHKIAARR